ncbi:MAG: toxin-antitoxin system antitoxin subunit [Streptococcaceae bacterium]|jgi:addiction module RelB/DinJ family antitoxin|nr:toxin-antitoxin system antitoxin subunit [Streptococcaceae bacterium]
MLLPNDSLKKNTQVNFKTNNELLSAAKEIFSENNLDLTAAINFFLQNVVAKGKLPYKTEDEIKREKLIKNLQRDINKSVKNYEMGLGLSEEEARKRFGV